MEDAMIINKSSEERGLAHGMIYKSEFVELDHVDSYFEREPPTKDKPFNLPKFIDSDGLPYVGRILKESEPLYSFFDADRQHYVVKNFKGKEECYLHSVKLCANFGQKNAKKTVCFTYRVPVS